jgi:anti-sigma factor RsiW
VNDVVEQLSCQELVELVTDYLEDALPADERTRFERHIGSCGGCTRYLEQMRTTIRVTGELRPDDLSADAERTLLDAFRAWKR